MCIPVLFSDDFLLICEKPVGISSESPGLPDLLTAQTGVRLWPVHRLDQGTGGVVILAKSPEACNCLQKEFQANHIRKEYCAVVSGTPPELSGRFEDLLFHDIRKNKSYVVNRERAGVKRAVCEWKLEGYASTSEQVFSLVSVVLHTGRTHQIRVQFASRGMPLIGDRRYGSRIKADTPALWACGICFPHPVMKDRTISAVSAPPSVFPWNLFPDRVL